jgi:CAAX protease family protein
MATLATLSMRKANVTQQSPSRTLVLYLLPGALITLVFVLIAALTMQLGWPASLALLLTWLMAGIPLELGFLIYQGWKRNRRFSLTGVVLFREHLPGRQYLWLVPVLFLWVAMSSTLSMPLAERLRLTLFPWWPDWLVLSTFAQKLKLYSPGVLWAVVILSFVLNVAVPVVEELYFRGYLLPRMAAWSKWAPLINVVLFSLYHFWLPWENPTRIITLLPVVYAVQWKRNIYLSILTHCLLNTIGSFGLLLLVMSPR